MRYTVVLLVLLVQGCVTTQGDTAKSMLRAKSAQIADQHLKTILWSLCNGVSIGAVRRWADDAVIKKQGYTMICAPSVQVPIPPVGDPV